MRRLIAVIMMLLMLTGSTLPAFGAIVTNADPWAKTSMELAYNQGLIKQEDLLDAKRDITRLEFCKIVVLLYEKSIGEKLVPQNESPFTDCDDPAVISAYEAGIISGTEPTKFEPNKSLTREQLAIMLNRILKAWGIALSPGTEKYAFSDISMLMEPSIDVINKIYEAGILVGDNNGKFYPMRALKFQEAVIGLVKACRYLEENAVLPKNDGATDEKEEPKEEVTVEKEKPKEEVKTPADEKQDVKNIYETVYIKDKAVSLGGTSEALIKSWGKPDRIDQTVFGLKRYVYIGDYETYFFATLKDNKIVEVFVPTKHFSYLETHGEGTSADIKQLDFISLVDHSGIIDTETTYARIPLDYEGKIQGVLLQNREFAYGTDVRSGLTTLERDSLRKELFDFIQVKRKAHGLPLLTEHEKLTDVAFSHSKDMVENNYFSYTGKDGSNPFIRILSGGVVFTNASEIIVKQRGDVTNVYQQWMRTAAQYHSLLDPSMDSIGIGVAQKDKDLYVTIDFCGGIKG
ncbi:CAP domain-containing protein [Anaerotignum sp. MB30-C6]|uniref:CAP domain-containing protein n=1 Tax=Anaerotignum sp. MB30-C6 TaxID=3070814 RepID=UPI0027DB7146|nr:S-layer homology domain-containing protein [Anaerotignum sp. MB30-C6]WMI82153.1 S-layer homology domain-containing protein [Anaerotignum sp. MB30-C6]